MLTVADHPQLLVRFNTYKWSDDESETQTIDSDSSAVSNEVPGGIEVDNEAETDNFVQNEMGTFLIEKYY
jgi:hypothetical protein